MPNLPLIRRVGFLGAFSLIALQSAAPATAQDVSLSFAPVASWMEWDDELEFERSTLFGGAIELGFGRFIGLSGYHLRAGDAALSTDPSAPVFDLERTGVRLSMALGTGSVVPLLSGGGSVMSFSPEGADRERRIGVDWGGGLRVRFGDALTGDVLVHRGQLRLDPDELLGQPQTGEAALRRNLSLSAGFGLQLGRRSNQGVAESDAAFAERMRNPLSNLALTVEPMAARLDWADETGLPQEDMIGVRAGLDFGPFFALRGYHWWGTEDDFHTTTGMRAWGGEAQFNLRAGHSLTPYLTGGAARFTWDDPDPSSSFSPPADQDALVVGGGLEFDLGSLVRANVGVRDVILSGADLSSSSEFDTGIDPSDLVHSWQFVAGFQLRISSDGIGRAPRRGDDRPTDRVRAAQDASDAERDVGPADSTADGRVVQLPVPERGEIVIRYGDIDSTAVVGTGAADSALSERLIEILERMDRRLAALEAGEPLAADSVVRSDSLRAAADSVATRIAQSAGDPELRALLEQMNRRLAALESGDGPTTVVTSRPDVVVEASGAEADRGLFELRPWIGTGPSSHRDRDGRQIIFGIAADIGELNAGSPLHMVPEIAVGFGAGGSFLASLGLEYAFPAFTVKERVEFEPHLGVGPALLIADRYSARLTTMLGTGIRIMNEEGEESANLFLAIQGTDLFSEARIQLGVRRIR